MLDTITEQLGLGKLLKACFPQDYNQIQAMAYYLVSRGGPLSYCEAWCKNHAHAAQSLTSQRISEILGSISIDKRQTFFTKWMDKVLEDDYLCYDITSISSYSEFNEFIIINGYSMLLMTFMKSSRVQMGTKNLMKKFSMFILASIHGVRINVVAICIFITMRLRGPMPLIGLIDN